MIAESSAISAAFDVEDRNESDQQQQQQQQHIPLGNVTSLTLDTEPGAADSLNERNWEALALILVVLAGITGNLLVCVAVRLERKLQTVTNYFLVSLAIADLFVSTVVMPCCIVQEFVGYWPLGFVVCDFWQVSDVMLCTSSIMHMCVISIDRYAGIRSPLVARNRSSAVVAFKIGFVWFLSFFISCPLIFLAIFRPQDLISSDFHCAIMNRHFLVYGSLSAFFIPLLIMVVAYSLSMRLLSAQARRLSGKAANSGEESEIRRSCKGSSHGGTLLADVVRLTGKQCKQDKTLSPDERTTAPASAAVANENPMFDASPDACLSSEPGSLLAETFPTSSRSFFSSAQSTSIASPSDANSCSRRGRLGPKRSKDSNPTHHSLCYHRQPSSSSSAVSRPSAFRSRRSGNYLPIDNSETSLTALVDLMEKHESTQQQQQQQQQHQQQQQQQQQQHQQQQQKEVDDHRLKTQETGLDCITDLYGENGSGHRGHARTASDAVARWPDRRRDVNVPDRNHDDDDDDDDDDDQSTRRYSVLQHISRVARSLYNLTAALHRPTPNRRRITTPAVNGLQDVVAGSSKPRFRSLVQKHSATLRVAGILIAKRENRTRAELHSVRTERKAVRVLGAMFAIFVCCWGPFFAVNLAMGCSELFQFDDTLFKALLWLGYLSSTLNPIVYTVFNKNFRTVFVDVILFRRIFRRIETDVRTPDA